jgi:hypothetical protein
MKSVFLATFKGHYLPGNAIVVADTKRKAYNKLKKELQKQGLGNDLKVEDLTIVDLNFDSCDIIFNGDY